MSNKIHRYLKFDITPSVMNYVTIDLLSKK